MRVEPAGSLLFALIVSGGLTGAAAANPLDTLQGAWAMYGADCGAIFEKAGDEIRFKEENSSLNNGIIISGDRIVASNAACTVTNLRQLETHFSVQMNCATSILLDSVSMSFRITDASHFERIDPDFPDFALEFSKCPL